jgi:hypothetical protein
VRDLVAAHRALWRARARLRREPVGTLTMRDIAPAAPVSGDPRRAAALADAVVTAATHGLFRPLCLAQSLALQDLLTRHGIAGSEIRVGVRHRDGRLAAHAWVRWGEQVLGDDPDHVATFTEVDDIRVLSAQ